MKCPYNSDQTVQINVNCYTFDENGNCTKHRHKLVEQHDLMDCLQEECAAWRDGHCEYRGATN